MLINSWLVLVHCNIPLIAAFAPQACIDNEYMIPKQLVAASSDEEDAVVGKQNSLPKRIYNKYTLDATYQQQLKKLYVLSFV